MKYSSKWQRTVEFNSDLKNKLNKHAAEQRKAVRFERTTINAVLQKWLHLTQLNVKEIVTCTRCGFSVPSFSTKLLKKQVYKFKRLNCSCCCFDIDHSLKSSHLKTMHIKSEVNPYWEQKLFSPQLTVAFKLHRESLFHFINFFFTLFDKTWINSPRCEKVSLSLTNFFL